MRNWKSHLVQKLNDGDPDGRDEFWNWYLNECDLGDDFQDRILWTDEAQFKLNGSVNKHNYVYYSTENPNLVEEVPINSPGVTVWGGISSFAPVFFEETVHQENYLNMLEDKVMPELASLNNFN